MENLTVVPGRIFVTSRHNLASDNCINTGNSVLFFILNFLDGMTLPIFDLNKTLLLHYYCTQIYYCALPHHIILNKTQVTIWKTQM